MIDSTSQTYRLSRVGNLKFSRAPTDLNPPPAPQLVSAVPTDTSMALVWINGVDAETLTIDARVRYSLQGQNSWSPYTVLSLPGNSLTIPGLTASTGYDFQIVNDDVAGNTSSILAFTRTTSAAPQNASPGLIALPLSSIAVQEGRGFTFAITQTGAGPASPVVDVQWQISGFTEGMPVPQSGTVQFQPGQNGSQLVTLTAGLVTADRSGTISIVNATSETGTVNPSVGNAQCALSIVNIPSGKKWPVGYIGATNNFTWPDDRKLVNQDIEQNLILSGGPNVAGYKMWYYTGALGDAPAWDFTKLFRDLNKIRAGGKIFMPGFLPVLYGAGSYTDILWPTLYNDASMGASPVAGKYGWWTINGGTGKLAAFWRANVMTAFISFFQAMAAAVNPTTGFSIDADPLVMEFSFTETSLSVDGGSDYTTAAALVQYQRLISAMSGYNTIFMVNNNYATASLAQALNDYIYASQCAGGGPDIYAIGQHGTGTYGSLTGGQLAYLGRASGNPNYLGPDLRGKMAMMSDTQGPEISLSSRYTMYTPHSFKTVVDTILEQSCMKVTMVNTSATDKPNPPYPADGVNTAPNPGNWSSFREVFDGAPLSHIARPTSIQIAATTALTDGGNAVITGSGFGTNVPAANQAWLGGVNGAVESAANGTNIKQGGGSGILGSNWQVGIAATPQLVSTARFFSGTRSILQRYGYSVASGGSYDPSTNYQYGFQYDFGAVVKSFYLNYRIFWLNNTLGQLKMFRLVGAAGGGISDANVPNSLFQQVVGVADANFNRIWTGQTGGLNQSINSGGSGGATANGAWVRHEMLIIPGTPGNADGSITWNLMNSETGAVLATGVTPGVQFLGASDAGFRYFVPQMFFGNAAEFDGAQSNIDRDLYLSANFTSTTCPKSLILGDAPTYSACTKRLLSMQRFDTWSDGSITFKANKGALSSLAPVWAYIMVGVDLPLSQTGIVPQAA